MKDTQMTYYVVANNHDTYIRFIRNFGFTPTAAVYLDHFHQIKGVRSLYVILADSWESRNDLSDLLVELRLRDARVLEHSIFSKAMVIPERFIPIAEFFTKKLNEYTKSANDKLRDGDFKVESNIKFAIVKSSYEIANSNLKILGVEQNDARDAAEMNKEK
mgnify:CR=1 FL=1